MNLNSVGVIISKYMIALDDNSVSNDLYDEIKEKISTNSKDSIGFINLVLSVYQQKLESSQILVDDGINQFEAEYIKCGLDENFCPYIEISDLIKFIFNNIKNSSIDSIGLVELKRLYNSIKDCSSAFIRKCVDVCILRKIVNNNLVLIDKDFTKELIQTVDKLSVNNPDTLDIDKGFIDFSILNTVLRL